VRPPALKRSVLTPTRTTIVLTLARPSEPDIAAGKPARWSNSAAGLLRLQVFVTILIPARYVLTPLGSLGSPALLLGVVCALVWLVGTLSDIDQQFRACVPLRLVLAGLWATLLASYLNMHFQTVPLDESGNSDRLLVLLLATSGISLLAAEGLRTRDDVLAVVRSIVLASTLMATIALLQFRIGWDPIAYLSKIPLISTGSDFGGVLSRSSFRRPAGTAGHPIEYGVAVAAALAFAIHLLLHDTERSLRARWTQFGLIGLGIPISISRSALFVAMIVLAFFLVGAPSRVRLWSTGVIASFGVVVFMTVPGLIGTFRGLIGAGESDTSISTRTSDYDAAEPFISESPWIGRGPGTFLPKYFILDNQYLAATIEIGLLGAGVFMAYMLLPAFLGRGARHRCADEAGRSLGQTFAGAGFAAAIAAGFYDFLSFAMFTMVNAVTLGVAAAFWMRVRNESVEALETAR
jgi:O-antigen ligase